MAYTDVVPTTQFLALSQAAKIEIPFPCIDSAGADVDMSTWNVFTLVVNLPGGSGAATAPITLTGDADGPEFIGATGKVTAVLTTGVINGVLPGSYAYQLVGKPTGGDQDQLLSSGNAQVIPDIA